MVAKLLFSDEFGSFDAYSKTDGWRTAYHWGANTVINGEKGYYVDTENSGRTGPAGSVNPFSVSNGVLTITSAPASGLPNGTTYTTGVISSMGSFEHQYGYYEIRADMSGGKGFWPAFWLMPSNKISPPELDIMEFSSRLPNEYATTLHSNAGGSYTMSQNFAKSLPDLSNGFHTYAVNWQADRITWYFDDKEVYSVKTPSDMHTPMYMLINQAVGGGGSWIGNPDGSTQQYKIDYVRVYDDRPTGQPADPAPTPTPPPAGGASASAKVVVNAHGDPAGGTNAHFNVLIDGQKIGEATVATGAKNYTFTADVAAGQAHKIQVQFDNNADIGGADRNLYVNAVSVNGHAIAPDSGSVVYDRGPIDGQDVLPGQSTMYWNGALVVSTPASYYTSAAAPPAPPPPAPAPSTDTASIVITAHGSAVRGAYAHFDVMIDGKKIGEGTTGATAKDYTFTAQVSADHAHKVQIEFDNDAYAKPADRNLYVDGIVINGRSVAPTDSIVSYDKGALDGKDVLSGRSEMMWNGTLVVNADQSFFTSAKAAAMAAANVEVWHTVTQPEADAMPAPALMPMDLGTATDHSLFAIDGALHGSDMHLDMAA